MKRHVSRSCKRLVLLAASLPGFACYEGWHYNGPGIAELIPSTSGPKCLQAAWVVDERPVDEILQADEDAPKYLRVTRTSGTMVVLDQPVMHEGRLVGWDHADSRIKRPFTIIRLDEVATVEHFRCTVWEPPR